MDMIALEPTFEKALIAAISRGLPLVKRPYAEIASQIGSTEALVIDGIRHLIQRGDIKRFGVIVRHRKLGYLANAMVVWDIPDERIVELGNSISRYDFVNLCYQRPRRLPDWPYNLFCMIHGLDHDDVIRQVKLINKQCGLTKNKFDILFSRRCFKQRGATYSASKASTPLRLNQDCQNG